MLEELQDILKSAGSQIERKLYFLGWPNCQLADLNVNKFPVLIKKWVPCIRLINRRHNHRQIMRICILGFTFGW